jgi:rRNA maturation RNase YbeY
MPSISFFNVNIKKTIKHKRILKKLITSIFTDEGRTFKSLSFIFCSDEYLLTLNRQYLNHDYYTDILTFDLSIDKKIISDIYISLDRVLDNSKAHYVSFQEELVRVIFHGVLHLCGYGDGSALEKKKMTVKENEYLTKHEAFHVKR